MTMADHPHFTVRLTLEVMYCDGGHPDGDGTQHRATLQGALAVVSPPADYHVNGAGQRVWPPSSVEEGDAAADAFVTSWGDILTSHALAGIPGCERVGIIDPDYLERR